MPVVRWRDSQLLITPYHPVSRREQDVDGIHPLSQPYSSTPAHALSAGGEPGDSVGLSGVKAVRSAELVSA
jgi:hypothetical protein